MAELLEIRIGGSMEIIEKSPVEMSTGDFLLYQSSRRQVFLIQSDSKIHI